MNSISQTYSDSDDGPALNEEDPIDNKFDPLDFIPNKQNFIPVNEGSPFHYYYSPEQGVSEEPLSSSPIVNIENNNIEYIVKFGSSYDDGKFQLLNSRYNAEVVDVKDSLNAQVVSIPLDRVSQFTSDISNIQGFQYTEPNYYYSLDFFPNDPEWANQWGPQIMSMADAWDTSTGNRSVVVAVIDTGIDYTHPELADAYLDIGYDWFNDDTDPFDDHYHGTHVSGTIAASINNAVGIAGIGNVSVMAEKIFSSSGSFAGTVDAAAAIDHAVAQGADILSNSWGGGGYSQLLADAVANAVGNGSMFIAAAGNDASSTIQYPAGYPGAISVSATDNADNLASFSNYGDWIDIAAPGVDILSTYPIAQGSYNTISGTSMATPHVSGLAALIMSQFPEYTIDQVEELIYLSSDDIGPQGFDPSFGHGRLNGSAAMLGLPDHELKITQNIPNTVSQSSTIELSATLTNIGISTETNVDFELYLDDVVVNSTTIPSFASGTNYTLTYLWNADTLGTYNITSATPLIAGEFYTNNNVVTTIVNVVDLANYNETYPGYTWYDAATNGVNLGMSGDDVSTSVSLPFNFTYYDSNFSTIYVSSNGWLSFVDSSPTAYSNPSFPTSTYDYAIALLWDDLQASNNVYAYTTSEYVVIEYVDYYSLSGSLYGTFAVVLYEYGGIQFLYKDIQSYLSPTVGLNYGLDTNFYNSYTSSLLGATEFAIGYNYIPPEYETSVDVDIPSYIEANTSNLIEASVTNDGQHNESDVELYLYIDDVIVNSSVISSLSPGEIATIQYNWSPTVEGSYNFTVYSPAGVNDTYPSNNRIETSVDFIVPEGRIGFITAHGEYYASAIATLYTNQGYYTEQITTVDNYIMTFDLLIVSEGGTSWSSTDLSLLDDYFNAGGKVAVFGDSSTSSISWITSYGLSLTGLSASSGSTTNIVDHPLMTGVSEMYAGGPVNSLSYTNGQSLVMDSSNTNSIVGISSMVNLIAYTDDMRSYYSYSDNSVFLMNLVTNWLDEQYELSTSLKVPDTPIVDETYLVEATIWNWGWNDSSNVNVSLFLDELLVNSTTSMDILSGDYAIVNYLWTPTLTGSHNFTVYVEPLINETQITNNLATELVNVSTRDQAYGYTEFRIYNNLNSSSITGARIQVYNSTNNLIDDGYTDVSGFYNVTGLDVGSYSYNITAGGYFNTTYSNVIDFIGEFETFTAYLDPILDHELIVTLTDPGIVSVDDETTISSTILNDGVLDETNIQFRLYINDNLVNSDLILSLLSGQSIELNYSWIPSTVGNFNLTAYAVPIVNETIISNNVDSVFVNAIDLSQTVAILNADSSETPGYWTGGWGNSYSTIYNGLIGAGMSAIVVTNADILAGALDGIPVLILIDNAPSDAASSVVKSWWQGGGSILSFDSSISMINWAGALPVEAEGTSGSNTYWDYSANSQGVVVNPNHPVASGYSNGSTISGSSGDAQYYSSVMQGTTYGSYYNPIVKSALGSDYDYVVASDAPHGGPIVQFWDHQHWSTTSNQMMIMNAISWLGFSANHDIEAKVDAPDEWGIDVSVEITAEFTNIGRNNETNVNLFLYMNTVLVDSKTISNFLIDTSYNITYLWTPSIEQNVNFTAYVTPVGNETTIDNNRATHFSKSVKLLPLLPGVFQYYITDGDYFDKYYFEDWEVQNVTINGVRELYNRTTGELLSTEDFQVNVITGLVYSGWMNATSYWGVTRASELATGSEFGWLNSTVQIYGSVDYIYNGASRSSWIAYSPEYEGSVIFDKETGVFLNFNYSSVYLNDTNLFIADGVPVIEGSDDFTYSSVETGNSISWTISDGDPDEYMIYLEGVLIESGDYISGNPIVINVDGLTVGSHNYTIVVNDRSGNFNSDTIFVSVLDITAPTISNETGFTYEYGQNGHEITWTGNDRFPDNYIMLDGDTIIEEGSWSSSITINMDGLEVGTHYLTLVIYDEDGNWASDWVTITVVDTTAPQLMNGPSDLIMESNTEDNSIGWEYRDPHPGTYIIFRNGTGIDFSNWANYDPISMSLDNLPSGVYNYTIVVEDAYNNLASHSVIVTVDNSDSIGDLEMVIATAGIVILLSSATVIIIRRRRG